MNDAQFGELVTNYEQQTCTIQITATSPHRRYKGIMYMNIEVRDNFGNITYEMVVEGTTNVSYNEIPIKEGYVIQIYHVEGPIRMYAQEAIIDVTNTTNSWLVTRYGLKNLRLRNDPLHDFVKRLDEQAINLLSSSLPFMESEDAQHLLVAIFSLPQPHSSLYIMKYITMFPKCVIQPVIDNKSDKMFIEGSIDIILKQNVVELIGTAVQLRRGQDLIVQDTLYEHQTLLHFEGIRQGIYSVEFRGKSVERYVTTPQYIEVKDYIVNTIEFDFEKINCSVLMDQTIEFYGLGQALFGAIRASYEEESIIISVMRKDAHPYFGNVYYVVVVVTTGEGVTKYRKEITGLNNTICDDVIPLMEGDIIKIYHKEGSNRLRSKNVLIDKSLRANTWLITKYGLQNLKFNKSPLDDLLNTIDSKATEIASSPFKFGISFYLSEEKKQLLAAVNYLPETQRYLYHKKYSAFFPKNRGTFTVSFMLDYPEELAGHNIGIYNDYLNQVQNVKGHVVTFNYVPYGYYSIRVPE